MVFHFSEVLSERFCMIAVEYAAKTTLDEYFPAEIGALAVSLQMGIQAVYHCFVEPSISLVFLQSLALSYRPNKGQVTYWICLDAIPYRPAKSYQHIHSAQGLGFLRYLPWPEFENTAQKGIPKTGRLILHCLLVLKNMTRENITKIWENMTRESLQNCRLDTVLWLKSGANPVIGFRCSSLRSATNTRRFWRLCAIWPETTSRCSSVSPQNTNRRCSQWSFSEDRPPVGLLSVFFTQNLRKSHLWEFRLELHAEHLLRGGSVGRIVPMGLLDFGSAVAARAHRLSSPLRLRFRAKDSVWKWQRKAPLQLRVCAPVLFCTISAVISTNSKTFSTAPKRLWISWRASELLVNSSPDLKLQWRCFLVVTFSIVSAWNICYPREFREVERRWRCKRKQKRPTVTGPIFQESPLRMDGTREEELSEPESLIRVLSRPNSTWLFTSFCSLVCTCH